MSVRPKLCVLLVAAAVGAPAIANGFVWDDFQLITRSPVIGAAWSTVLTAPFLIDPTTQTAHYYRPVTQLWYAVIYRLAGPSPWAFHACSLALHLATVWLAVGWIERRVRLPESGDLSRLSLPLMAAAGSLLFALHPARPQTVSWVSGAGDLLSCLWFLLAAAAFDRRETQRGAIVLTAALCAIATLSKESGVIFPIVLGVDAALRETQPAARMRIVRALFWPIAGVAFALAIRAPFAPAAARPELTALSALRVLTSLGYSASAVFWPWNPRHQLNVGVETLSALEPRIQLWLGVGLLTATATIMLILLARRRPQLRAPLADASVSLLTLLPSLNLVPIGVGMTLSERFLSLPLLGLSALATRGLVRGSRRPMFATAIAAGALIAFSAINLRETRVLASERSLYERFYAQDPDEISSLDALLQLRLRAGDLLGARALSIHRLQLILRGGDANARATASRSAECALALLSCVRFELLITSDHDQPRLVELRNVLDALASDDLAVAQLRLADSDVRVPLDHAAHEAARKPTAAGDLREDRVLAHARTLDLATAEQLAQRWSTAEPSSTRARQLRIRTLLWQERWSDALSALTPEEQGLASAIHSAEQRAAQVAGPMPTDASRLARAEILAGFGLPAAALALIREVSPSESRARVESLIAVADKRPDLVRALGYDAPPLPFARSSFAEYERSARLQLGPPPAVRPR